MYKKVTFLNNPEESICLKTQPKAGITCHINFSYSTYIPYMALNNLQGLICHKRKQTNKQTNIFS